MSHSFIEDIESLDSRSQQSLAHAESPEDLRTSEAFFDAEETDHRHTILAAAETPRGSRAQSQRGSSTDPESDTEKAELETDWTWRKQALMQTESAVMADIETTTGAETASEEVLDEEASIADTTSGAVDTSAAAVAAKTSSSVDTASEAVDPSTAAVPAKEASSADATLEAESKTGRKLGRQASVHTKECEDSTSGAKHEPLTQAASLPTLPTMMTARTSLSAQSSVSNLQRPTLTYFLTTQEERLALAALSSHAQGVDRQPRSLKQHRPAVRHPGYELDAHCCLQEARIASDVDNQIQLGGSASSARVGVSRNASCRSLLPDGGEQVAKEDPVSTTHTPKPPLSARSRGCPARRNQRFKPGNEVSSQVTEAAAWNPVRSMESLAEPSQRAEEAKNEDVGDAKRGVAFLEEQLKGSMVETQNTNTRWTRPPPKRPETMPRIVLATMRDSNTYQKLQPRSSNAKAGKVSAHLEGNSALSETDALKLKDTLDTLRGLLGKDGTQSARSRPASQRWSENWAVQNSAPLSFRLPMDILQKPRGASGAKSACSPTAGCDAELTRDSEAEQPLEPEPPAEQQQSQSNASAASPRKKRKKPVAWLPPLRPVPVPAVSILLPKRGVKDADGEKTLPCVVEESQDGS